MPETEERMRPMAMIKRLSAVAAVIATGLLAAGTARADEVDYLALDEASKQAIRNACGSWAYRDADRWIAPWVEAVDDAAAAARIWALADLAANLSDRAERERVVTYGRSLAPPPRLSASLRPLAVLATLGAASLARGGGALLSGPASAFHALRTGLTGR